MSISAGYAQEKGFHASLATRAEALNLNGDKHLHTIAVSFAPGYAFNSRLFLRGQFDAVFTMWNRPGARTYIPSGTFGPSVGYNILRDSNGSGILDVTASVGHSLTVKEWRYVYYDVGVNWSFPAIKPHPKFAERLFFGIGVRYNDSYRSNVRDQVNLYAQFGFRFN